MIAFHSWGINPDFHHGRGGCRMSRELNLNDRCLAVAAVALKQLLRKVAGSRSGNW